MILQLIAGFKALFAIKEVLNVSEDEQMVVVLKDFGIVQSLRPNAGLATVLAGNFFAAQPLAVLPCAISCAWHSISGTILAGIFLRFDTRRLKP